MSKVVAYFDINNRVYYHIIFWLTYYVYRVMIYGDIKNTYENVAYVQALEMILKIVVVYIFIYVLKPKYFDKKQYVYFALSALITVGIASYLQLHVIWFCVNLGIFNNATYDTVFSVYRFRSSAGHINWILFAAFMIKMAKETYENAQINTELVKGKLEAELQLLKSQVNPHFFFNTLNNLYALTQKKSDQAPEVVHKLSELMSYMIYDTTNQTVEFKKEINFIENYIQLEKLRYGDYLIVNFDVDSITKKIQLPPLLFIPFIENAFKHGVARGGDKNKIDISFVVVESQLDFKVVNSKAKNLERLTNGKSGMGLSNIERRLELLYPDKHRLNIKDEEQQFTVELKIELDGLIHTNEKV